MEIAAFLVVMDKHLHPERAEATMAAVRQLRGVAGVTTIYHDIGEEIKAIRQVREDVQRDVLDRARLAGSV